MALQTPSSPKLSRRRRQGCSRGVAARPLPACAALLLTLALAACGGGQQAASTVTVSAAPAAPAPATTEAPAATTPAATTEAPRGEPGGAQATTPATTPTQPQAQAPPAETTPAAEPEPTTRPARREERADPQPAATPIEETAHLTLVSRPSPREYTQAGTVTGTYDGTMTVAAEITNRGVAVVFTAVIDGDEIHGRGLAKPIIGGSPMAQLTGTAEITGGTGRFAEIRGRGLRIGGRAALDGSRGTVKLSGFVTGV